MDSRAFLNMIIGMKMGNCSKLFNIAKYFQDHSREVTAIAQEIGPKKQCFTNATKMCLFDKNYDYVEGYVINKNIGGGLPIEHAWVYNKKEDQHIDCTLETASSNTYIGLIYPREIVERLIKDDNYCGSMFDTICMWRNMNKKDAKNLNNLLDMYN